MAKQDILDIITEIGTIEDDVERRNKLVELSDSIEKDYTTFETLTQTNEELEKANASLKQANMDLFLRVSSPKDEPPKDEPEKMEFEDLFNEKGELK